MIFDNLMDIPNIIVILLFNPIAIGVLAGVVLGLIYLVYKGVSKNDTR